MNFVKGTYSLFVLGRILLLLFILQGCTDSKTEALPIATQKAIEDKCNKDDIQHEKLLTVRQAHSFLKDSNYLFVEVSKTSEYNKGHIPSALHVWRPDFRSKLDTPVTGMRCSPEEFVAFLQNLGLTNEKTLIVYDAKGGSDALRLAWVFDYYGYEKYKVINGGKKAWTMAGFALDKELVPAVNNTAYHFEVKENQSILASHNEVQSAIRDTQTLIIDTRENYEHSGQCFLHQGKILSHKKGAYDRGCIPGSIHLNWSTLSDLAHDHRIKCTKDLKYDLANKGITKDKNIIVYCQSGSRSSHTAFVLKEILGYPNVKNYDGSWIEWSYLSKQKGAPVELHTSKEDFDKELLKLTAGLSKE